MTIVLYSLLLIAIGYACRRSTRDNEGYFLAGRGLSAFEVGMTLAATAFGGSAILIASRMIYTLGLAGLWFSGSVALGFGVLGLGFARRIRASGAVSLADYYRIHYGAAAQRIASALIVLVEITFFGLTVKSFALMTTPLFGESRWLVHSEAGFEALITGVFILYTLMGGHKAIAVTAIVQFGIIFFGLLCVLLPLGLFHADFAALPAGFLRLPTAPGAGWTFILNMGVLMGLSGVVGGDVFSKILSARDERAARGGALTAAAAFGSLAVAIALLALCARALLPALAQPELAVLLLGRRLLPPALFEIVSLAFLSALLSTGDSVLMTGATVLALDVLKLRRTGVARIRLLTLGLALAGLGLALYTRQLLEIMKFGYTLLTASLIVPAIFTLALAGRRKPRTGFVLAAIGAGLGAASLWKAAPLLAAGFKSPLDPATIGVGCSAAVMAAGLFFPPHPAPMRPRRVTATSHATLDRRSR